MKSRNDGRFLAAMMSTHQNGASKTRYRRFICPPWHPPSPQNVHMQHSAATHRLRSVAHAMERRTTTTSDSRSNRAGRCGESALCRHAPLAANYLFGMAKPVTTTLE